MRCRLRTLLIVLGLVVFVGLAYLRLVPPLVRTTEAPPLNSFDDPDETIIWLEGWQALPARPPGEV